MSTTQKVAMLIFGPLEGYLLGGLFDSKEQQPKPSGLDLTVQTSTYGAFIPRAYNKIALKGNIFWVENGSIKEIARIEDQGGKGGPSQDSPTTYTYYGTFAVGLVDCSGGDPIIGVERIWIGSTLFYNAGSTDHDTLIASNTAARGFKVYLGSDSQSADPRMQATLGVNNVPGHRGLAYIVFYDLPLADYGNSLASAQIKVEVVCAGAVNYILELESSIAVASTDNVFHSNDRNYLYTLGSSYPVFSIFDISTPATPVFVNSVTLSSVVLGGSVTWTLMAVDGDYAYILGNGAGDFTAVNVYYILGTVGPVFKGSVLIYLNAKAIAARNSYVMAASSYAGYIKMIDATIPTAPVVVSTLSGMSDIVAITMDDYYAYALSAGSGIYVIDIRNPASISVVASITGISGASYMVVNGNYLYINSILGGSFAIVDISNPLAPATVFSSASFSGGPIDIDIGYLYLGRSRDSSDFHVYDLSDPILPVSIGYITSTSGGSAGFRGLTAYGNYIYTYNSANGHLETFFFVEGQITDTPIPLSAIVQAEVLTSKLLTAADIDVTALTSSVRGYRINAVGSIRGGIEPLQSAWPFDVIQRGYQIKFVPRGGSSVVTIPAGLLDARAAGNKPGVQITNSREMDSILPQKVSLKYFDAEREYDQGEQYAERINTDSVNLLSLDMAIVFNATEAAGKTQVLLYLYWMERYDISFSLPPDYGYLEPSDVITITSDDATYVLRLTSINYNSDGRLECRAKYNDAAIYTPTAIGESGQLTGLTLTLPGDTLYQLLDIPLIQDVYDKAGFPVAMTGYLANWPGCLLFRTVDAGQNWDDVQGFTPPGSVMGLTLSALSAHGGTVLDKAGVLTVRMRQSTLSSVTEAQMFAGANWFAYGADQRWEIIAVQNCVLQADGSYVLTDFLRGQFGSEWATGLHVVGDSFVHLSSSELAFVSMNLSSIGVEGQYRGITSGALIDSDTDRSFSYRGVNLECLSPCQLTGSRHPSTNDWTLTWTRRTRFAGWRDGVDAVLGETSESYEIDIFADGTYATVKRTLTATSQTAPYTSAQQVTDFGSNQATLYLKVYQLSANVGRGYPLIATLTR